MIRENGYTIRLWTNRSSVETRDLLRKALRAEGLEIAGEVDLSKEIESHTGLAFRAYTIINIWCPFATFHALLAVPEAGLFVPFHVVIASDNERTSVTVVNPTWLASVVDRIGFRLMTKNVGDKLRRALASLEPAAETNPELEKAVARNSE